jgi:hypothetical protein
MLLFSENFWKSLVIRLKAYHKQVLSWIVPGVDTQTFTTDANKERKSNGKKCKETDRSDWTSV